MFGSTTFYYKACDPTGCGNEVSFVTAAVTPLPYSTRGQVFTNFLEDGMNISKAPQVAINPYMNPFQPSSTQFGLALLTGLMLFSIFVGMTVRGKNVAVPAIAGGILSGLFLVSNSGLNLGVPPEFAAIGQGIFYVCIAGIVMSFFKRG